VGGYGENRRRERGAAHPESAPVGKPRGICGAAIQEVYEKKMLFFEKKNQKTFAPWRTWPSLTCVASAKEQKFFASFFQEINLASFAKTAAPPP
jgi:hypothetical protein